MASSGRNCLRSGKPYGRMAIQAGKSITSCPQLVSVPLTGLERMLSSSLNMDLSLPTSKGFTCLTAIIVVVWNCHGTSLCYGVYLYSVLAYEEASGKLRTRMAEKGLQNLVSRHKIRGIIKFISENRDFFRPP
ncbi:hypothetical protein AVEN_148564-1 [Araneus ventricosus]|uniref:Uncharacterized protein n=1 Tax=Araneus ventricosus TaxID=182803 RepID=A0A4Y2R442_ARAVE|nr:hypothetical protein AVEN_148564-1 [Araneus ventricosus]